MLFSLSSTGSQVGGKTALAGRRQRRFQCLPGRNQHVARWDAAARPLVMCRNGQGDAADADQGVGGPTSQASQLIQQRLEKADKEIAELTVKLDGARENLLAAVNDKQEKKLETTIRSLEKEKEMLLSSRKALEAQLSGLATAGIGIRFTMGADVAALSGTGLLEDVAPQLKLLPAQAGEPVLYSVRRPGFECRFHDPSGVVEQVEGWLREVQRYWCKDTLTNNIKPCYIGGPIKSGKSMVLGTILPAVVRRFNGGRTFGKVKVMRLSMLDMPAQEGLDSMRRFLLEQIVAQAQLLGIDTPALRLAAAQVQRGAVIGNAVITTIFQTMNVPILVLLDEVQNLLLPRTPSGRLDKPAQDSARLLLKRLLCYSSNYCMWAVTGSSMAVFWAQLDAMPVNGYAPLLHNVRVHLPATHEPAAISSVLDSILDREGVGRPAGKVPAPFDELLAWAENAALLCYAYDDFHEQKAVDMQAFLGRFTQGKLARESLAEWRVVLEAFTPRQRQLAAGLYNASVGCDLSDLGNEGLAMLLTFMTEPVLPGEPAVYLSGVFYRAALQLVVHPDGSLVDPLASVQLDRHLGFLDAWFHLGTWGEVVKTLLMTKDPSGTYRDILVSTLKVPAQELEHAQGPAADWRHQPWFRRLWFSRYNQPGGTNAVAVNDESSILRGGAAWSYLQALKAPGMTAEEHLAWYMYLLRNAIAHNQQSTAVLRPGLASGDVLSMVASSPVAQPTATLLQRFAKLRTCSVPKLPASSMP